MDVLNREWLLRHFEPHSWEPAEDGCGGVLLDKIVFNFETGRLDDHRTIVAADGTRTPVFVSQRLYALTELKAMLARCGLRYLCAYGGFDGAPYGMDSQRMIVLAERAVEARARLAKDLGLERAIKIKGRRRRR